MVPLSTLFDGGVCRVTLTQALFKSSRFEDFEEKDFMKRIRMREDGADTPGAVHPWNRSKLDAISGALTMAVAFGAWVGKETKLSQQQVRITAS